MREELTICRGCAKILKSGNQRFSLNVTLIRNAGEEAEKSLLECTDAEFTLEEALNVYTPPEFGEGIPLWMRYTVLVCAECREPALLLLESLKNRQKTENGKPFSHVRVESIVGYEQLEFTEEDLARDLEKEMEETLAELRSKNGEQLHREICFHDRFPLDEEKTRELMDQFQELYFRIQQNSDIQIHPAHSVH